MMENSASNTVLPRGPAAGREISGMTEELSGRRIVVPETRELDQLVRLLGRAWRRGLSLSNDGHPRRARRGTYSGVAPPVRGRKVRRSCVNDR